MKKKLLVTQEYCSNVVASTSIFFSLCSSVAVGQASTMVQSQIYMKWTFAFIFHTKLKQTACNLHIFMVIWRIVTTTLTLQCKSIEMVGWISRELLFSTSTYTGIQITDNWGRFLKRRSQFDLDLFSIFHLLCVS